MLIIGITGGIGSGKSTIVDFLNSIHGIPVYKTDDRAKLLMNSNKIIKDQIKATFGDDLYTNGSLNRKQLANIVFNNKEQLANLNDIVHPVVYSDFCEWVDLQDSPYVVKESAILFESGGDLAVDYTVTVLANYDIRVQRVINRDSCEREDVVARIENQKDPAEIAAMCDYVINNHSNDFGIVQTTATGFHNQMMERIKVLGRTSRYLALLLRHQPQKENLNIDSKGWVSTKEICKKLNIQIKELRYIVRSNSKKRFTLDSDRIKAAQGHSIDIDLELAEEVPPAYLYHGTPTKFIGSIMKEGLKKMKRHHVHLSSDRSTAETVGSRRGKAKILSIRSGEMHKQGCKFYKSENGVWLTDEVPVKYIEQ